MFHFFLISFLSSSSLFFFFNDPATTEIYTLSLHDALPIFSPGANSGQTLRGGHNIRRCNLRLFLRIVRALFQTLPSDRKSTRLNSSHLGISYAVFCLKKKKINT